MPQPKSTSSTRRRSDAGARGSAEERPGDQTQSRRSASDLGPAALSAARDLMLRGMSAPLGLVVLTRDRIQDAVDEAVERGRMTRADANDLVEELLRCGRTQSDEIFADLERLASGAAGAAARTGHRAAASARRAPQADRVLREVDRVRRAAGLGQTFPIVGYDDLTAAQVNQRLGDLSAAELRKVRDHERRHANRKTVLSAVESKLA